MYFLVSIFLLHFALFSLNFLQILLWDEIPLFFVCQHQNKPRVFDNQFRFKIGDWELGKLRSIKMQI